MLKNKTLSQAALVCVDWGSSNFRAFLLNKDGVLLDSVETNQGMLQLKPNDFEPILLKQLEVWLGDEKLPIIMAGMVGSAGGWQTTNYVTCPIAQQDLCANIVSIENSQNLNIAIIPGIETQKSEPKYDVARGEEVQVFGAMSMIGKHYIGDSLFCLPGTHSKWITMKNKKITQLSTHITGELFSILTKYSILAAQKPNNNRIDESVFIQALNYVKNFGGLANHLFSARTNMLNGQLDNVDIDNYISGILIGNEVLEMKREIPSLELDQKSNIIYLVGNKLLNNNYFMALKFFGFRPVILDGLAASYTGMYLIAKRAGYLI